MDIYEFGQALQNKGINVTFIMERALSEEITGAQALSELMELAAENIAHSPRRLKLIEDLEIGSWSKLVNWYSGMDTDEILVNLEWHHTGNTKNTYRAEEIYFVLNEENQA
jgi:hypothetical protein